MHICCNVKITLIKTGIGILWNTVYSLLLPYNEILSRRSGHTYSINMWDLMHWFADQKVTFIWNLVAFTIKWDVCASRVRRCRQIVQQRAVIFHSAWEKVLLFDTSLPIIKRFSSRPVDNAGRRLLVRLGNSHFKLWRSSVRLRIWLFRIVL